jgi:hypothetical protein
MSRGESKGCRGELLYGGCKAAAAMATVQCISIF